MKIRFGYACISKTLDITTSHTITYTNYEKICDDLKHQKLIETIEKNLDSLEQILIYNIKNNIHFYRMSSNIFPLINHPKISINILEIEQLKLKKIGNIINKYSLRVDLHLDPYYVLNSTNKEVVKSTINIIKFYKNMFEVMNIKSNIVIHVGSGVLGKQNSLKRFINNFNKLNLKEQQLIIIENDDKIFNIEDTLTLTQTLKVPMVLDYHHHLCNNNNELIESKIEKIFSTWETTPKIHFSSPKNSKERRSHNDYINSDEFIKFINRIKFVNKDFDIMIEAKEKDMALFKLIRELKYKGYNFIDETTLIL